MIITLHNITEIKPEGDAKTGIAPFTVDTRINQPVDLDFANIEKLIGCGDTKALRQLAHYRMGLRYSSDPINQLREFYLILEDEYGKDHSLLIPCAAFYYKKLVLVNAFHIKE